MNGLLQIVFLNFSWKILVKSGWNTVCSHEFTAARITIMNLCSIVSSASKEEYYSSTIGLNQRDKNQINQSLLSDSKSD